MNHSTHSDTANTLTVVINGEAILEYDRNKALSSSQQAFLDRMDAQMDVGVTLGGQKITSPDQLQRAQFVAVHLIEALQQENEPHAAASCAYLANRIPELKQVKADADNTDVHVDLVFDRDYSKEVRVDLCMPSPTRKH